MQGQSWTRRGVLAAMAAGAACAVLPPGARGTGAAPAAGGLVFRDVRVVDGTGAPARAADVLVRGGRVERIGSVSAAEARGLRTVAGGGRVGVLMDLVARK